MLRTSAGLITDQSLHYLSSTNRCYDTCIEFFRPRNTKKIKDF